MRFKHLLSLVLILCGTVSCTGQDKQDSQVKKPVNDETSLRNSAIFYASIAKHVQESYVEDTNYDELLEGALNGMLTSLDPHSSYLTPAKYEDLKNHTSGEFGGLGIEITMEEGLIKIISPIEDSPAFKAGLQPGDLIIRIGEEPIYGMSIVQAVDKLKGKPGTEVTFTVRRNNTRDIDVTIERAIIRVKAVKTRIEGNIGVVRILTFNEDTTQEVIKSVNQIKKELGNDLQGVILDVRNNAGGLLNQAISVSNLFLDTGRIVTVKTRSDQDVPQYVDANATDILDGIPMAILINSGSASSSEILAGALQDQKRAIVVGVRSFGKGSVQTVMPLNNGGAIKLTTALYYTPNGRSIQKLGIEPDINIEQAVDLTRIDESKRMRESSFGKALENGNGKKSKGKNGASLKNGDDTVVDYQLLRAVDVLKGIDFYKKAGVDKLQ